MPWVAHRRFVFSVTLNLRVFFAKTPNPTLYILAPTHFVEFVSASKIPPKLVVHRQDLHELVSFGGNDDNIYNNVNKYIESPQHLGPAKVDSINEIAFEFR